MHKDIAFLNESKAIWYTIDRREDVNGHFGDAPAQYRFDEQDVIAEKSHDARSLFAYYLWLTMSQRVLDKNPELLFRVPYVRAFFPDARFIFLVRNGWDTIHSIANWSRQARTSTGRGIEDWWGVNKKKWRILVNEIVAGDPLLCDDLDRIRRYGDDLHMAAVEWTVTMREGLARLRQHPDDMMLVRYEDITKCPHEVLTQLLDFCFLRKDSVMLEYAAQVLVKNTSKPPAKLPAPVSRAFEQTMHQLGYRSK